VLSGFIIHRSFSSYSLYTFMAYITRDFTHRRGDVGIAHSGCSSLKISFRLLAVESFSALPHADAVVKLTSYPLVT
jgi:hypothetical protein